MALGSCGSTTQEELPLCGVLITIDTTNAQALDMYGEDRGLTPSLARLAESSLIYDRAHTAVPITLPAHTSMMTGLYPLRHGVRDNGMMQLTPQAETLAERAREAGFQTAAFVSAAVLSASYGLDQGFDVYQDRPRGDKRKRGGVAGSRSDQVTDSALAWLEGRDRQQPFFLWVHYFDPHFPYDPPQEFLELARGKPYLGEVAAMDHDIGRLLDALESEVGLDKMLLAVLADHGEAHNRHGEQSHTAYCYESTMHIPFLLRFPDGRRAGTRSAEMVSVVDIFPTFLVEMGLGSFEQLDGVSLAGAELPADRGVYVESYSGYLNFGWSPLAGWINSKGKYLHSSKPESYDLSQDPNELTNLFDSGDFDTSSHVSALEALSKLPRLAAASAVQLDQEQLAELRALGYAAAGDVGEKALPGPLEPSDLPAPADGALIFQKYSNAVHLAGEHKNGQALALLREVLEASPKHIAALGILGGVLLEEGQFEEAAEVLERALALNSGKFTTLMNLGLAYESSGDLEQSLKQYRAAQVIRPGAKRIQKHIQRLEALSKEN
ncbi:MAG: choline-sulfatase [Candidatus Paceibacteria bacterium]|jgi:choline-sulfatase